MNKIQLFKHRCNIVFLSVLGEIIKLRLALLGLKLSQIGINQTESREKKIIISLTSYGRRMTKTTPVTIYSLLNQTKKADLVILWLDNNNWNDHNLPQSIITLQKYGLSVKYYSDIRSYKKHIPALKQFSNDLIITVDDDFYYSSKMVENLYQSYIKYPNHIITLRAHQIKFDSCGKLMPYNSWDMMQHGKINTPLFATTGGGCLLQLQLLHPDTLKQDIFMQLCPTADDIWFFFMEIMQHTPMVVLPKWKYMMIPLDTLYQKTHKGSSLQDLNRGRDENDIQIEAVMNYYHLSSKDLILQ